MAKCLSPSFDSVSTKKEARTLYADHDLKLIVKTVVLTEQRALTPNLAPLKSKAAFFKKALSGEYVKATPVATVVVPSGVVPLPALPPEEKKAQINAQIAAKRIHDAQRLWEEQGSDDQLALLREFQNFSTVEGYRKDITRRGLASMVSIALRTAFCQWYADRTWGTVSDQEMIDFLIG